MASVKAKIIRDQEYNRALADSRRSITEIIDRTANHIRNHAIDLVSDEEGTGRFYKKRGSGKPGRASAPDHPPASDTGHLRNQIHVVARRGRDRRNRPTRDVISRAGYSSYLEFGTENDDGSVRMAPRPFMQPSAEEGRMFMRRLARSRNSLRGRRRLNRTRRRR